MMELLKRFEEDAVADEDALSKEVFGGSDSEDEGETKEKSLVERFAGIDIGKQERVSSFSLLSIILIVRCSLIRGHVGNAHSGRKGEVYESA